jgi:MerR family regulatory protein
LTFAGRDHTLVFMDREATWVYFELTPQERNEVEAALPAITPVSGVAADVLQRMLDADPIAPRRATGPADQYASISEAAKVFGVTTQSIRNWIDKGLLAAYLTPAGTRKVRREGLERVKAFRARPRPPGPTYSDAEIDDIIEHMRDE